MDGGLNKIATALISLFAITFLLLLAQILFFFSRTRHHPTPTQPKQNCIYLFRWRTKTRIEPTEIASKVYDDSASPETAAVDQELEKWRVLCGPSRALFTIVEEEEEREGIESCECDSKPDFDTTPFHTPCGSPPFFSPSPTRDAGDFPVQKDSSDGSFLAIEITH
ncbi:uncharacterized protein LOC111447877 [Cucurbita moschata]|uniref:Uncharacterized protein LOC111447877 n=1 Tax=Cucurbita moschata TaxID=3662 RepID=A0A6J1FQJ7_CUCMO|nr:uncharacterized protein LOC111447877 [Cucurbita moschata]